MTLQQLYDVIVISETGSLNRAAEKLFVSQPALTGAVRELEKELSITIFNRTPRGVTLTPEILRVLAPKIMGLADDSSTVPIGLLGKFAKRPGICIIAEICSQKGQRALALRQWEEEKGWTQKGIGLPLTQLKEIKQLFQQTREVLDEQPIDDF